MAAKAIETQAEPTGGTQTAQKNRGSSIQVVEFILGKENFAIDLFDVREVVEYTTITHLPNVPAYLKGIIDLRGEITTIIDLKLRLNIPESSQLTAESSRIIVLDNKITKSKIGILVDDVTSVSTFEADRVDYTSASVSKEDTAIIGIIKRKVKVKDKEKNELIIWIDIKQLLEGISTG